MTGVDLQHREVGVDDHHLQVETVAVDLCDLQRPSDALLLGRFRHRLQVVLEKIEERVPFLGPAVEPPQRLDRLGEVGLEPEQSFPDVDDLLEVLGTRLRGLGHLDPEGDAPLGIAFGLLGRGQDRQQLRQIVGSTVKLSVEFHRGAVGGIEPPDLAKVELGLSRLAQLSPEQRSQLHEQRDIGLAALGARRQLQDLGQLGPILLLGQGRHHRSQGLGLAGRGLERLPKVRQSLVAVSQLLGDLRHRDLGLGALVAGLRQRGPIPQQGQELVRPFLPSQQALELLAGPAILGVELQAATQMRLAIGRVGPILEVHLPDRDEQAGRHLRIPGLLGLLQVAIGDGLPVRRDEGHLGQALGRRPVVGNALERRAQASLRLLVAQQLVGEDAPFFVQKIGPAHPIGGPGELEIDELDAELEVTPLPVPATRVGQGACQRLRLDACTVSRLESLERAEGARVFGVDLEGRQRCRNVGFHWDLKRAGAL